MIARFVRIQGVHSASRRKCLGDTLHRRLSCSIAIRLTQFLGQEISAWVVREWNDFGRTGGAVCVLDAKTLCVLSKQKVMYTIIRYSPYFKSTFPDDWEGAFLFVCILKGHNTSCPFSFSTNRKLRLYLVHHIRQVREHLLGTLYFE